MLKVTTQHGTHYLIDIEEQKAMRVKAEGRNDMAGDSDWFYYSYYCPYDRENGAYEENDSIYVGKSLYFELNGPRSYDWRITTDVVSVEKI